jgi:hypothetical protein
LNLSHQPYATGGSLPPFWEAIRKVCRAFVLLCRRLDLLSAASVAIDGSKFKAVNARDRNFTELRPAIRNNRSESLPKSQPALSRTLCFVRAVQSFSAQPVMNDASLEI